MFAVSSSCNWAVVSLPRRDCTCQEEAKHHTEQLSSMGGAPVHMRAQESIDQSQLETERLPWWWCQSQARPGWIHRKEARQCSQKLYKMCTSQQWGRIFVREWGKVTRGPTAGSVCHCYACQCDFDVSNLHSKVATRGEEMPWCRGNLVITGQLKYDLECVKVTWKLNWELPWYGNSCVQCVGY